MKRAFRVWEKNIAILVIIFGAAGYLIALSFSDQLLLTPSDAPIFEWMTLLKTLFFSSLKMLVAPMVFFSLLDGLLHMHSMSHLGDLGRWTLGYYFSTTIIAIIIGLIAVGLIHPWKDAPESKSHQLAKEHVLATDHFIEKKEALPIGVMTKMAKQVLDNPFSAFVNNNILGIVFWALLFGLGWLKVKPNDKILPKIINEIQLVLLKILSWVILFAPIGVFAIAFEFYLKFSFSMLTKLLSFCLLVFGATAFHAFVVLPLILKFVAKRPVIPFFKKAMKPLAIAFGSSSSSATLPVTLKTCEEELGVSPTVAGFVLPLGATMNMDGTALFEGIAAVFLAHIFGLDLSTIEMFGIFFMAIVSSVGAPGMPSGSMAGMQIVLLAAGIPLEGIGLLLLVERPLDTFRTAVNVQGDMVGALVVQRWMSQQKK